MTIGDEVLTSTFVVLGWPSVIALRPETLQVKGKLTVMFDGQKVKSLTPHQVERDIVVDRKLSQIVSLAKDTPESIQNDLSFLGPDSMSQERTAGKRKARELRAYIFEYSG
jgi:hypothetical protein